MLAALTLSLYLLGPAPAQPDAAAQPAGSTTSGSAGSSQPEGPAPSSSASSTQPTGSEHAPKSSDHPPAPKLVPHAGEPTQPSGPTQPGPTQPGPTQPVAPEAAPAVPVTPAASTGPAQPVPEPEQDYELRGRGDMPYAPTPARKSALRRGNEVLVRAFRKPVFTAAAAARLGVLVGGGVDVMQPLGYGFGAQIRAHFAPLYRARFGLELHAGHTRWSERESFESFEGATVTRSSLLSATDVSVGPSFEVPIGPVFVQLGGGAGMMVSSLNRPTSTDAIEDDKLNGIAFALRGGLSLGVPIFNGHGLSLGGAVHHAFSAKEAPIELSDPELDQTRPFGTSIEAFGSYSIWF